jgi:tRNA A-37 threonylcarbamoyl transferase component Bud32
MWGIDKKNPLSESSWFIKLQSELSKIIPSTSWLVDGILWWENTNKLSLELSDELLQSLVEISENSWKSFNDIFNQILESWTRNVLTGIKNDTEINKLLWGISFKNLEAEVLRFIWKNNSPYSSWTEADVYKMNIPWNESEVLLVKRKYENTSENEYSLHHIAKEIQNSYSGEWESIVHVPTPLYHFNDGDNEYILMEFIKWKTLHLIISEAILWQETIHLWKEIEDEYLRKEFYYYYYCYVNPGKDLLLMDDFLNLPINQILPLLCDNDWYLKDINFTTDEEWSNALLNIYRILKEWWVKVDFNPDWLQEMWIWKYVNELTHNKINKADLSKIALFSEKDSNAIIDSLKKFIDYMHEKWLYHLDLGANTRNIMFTKKDDWYRIDIIDFWRSIYFPEWLWYSEPYWKLAKDEEIINRIKTIGNLEWYKKIKLIDKEKEESLKDLVLIWNDFWISEAQIKNKYNSYNKNVDKHNFVSKLKLIFSTRDFWWYKFILGDAVNKEKQLERDKVNDIIKSEILVQLFFIIKKGEWFEIKNYINENIKWKYKNLYIDMFEKLNQIK